MKTNQVMHDIWIFTTEKDKYVGMVREYKDGTLVAVQNGRILGEIGTPEEAEKLFEA